MAEKIISDRLGADLSERDIIRWKDDVEQQAASSRDDLIAIIKASDFFLSDTVVKLEALLGLLADEIHKEGGLSPEAFALMDSVKAMQMRNAEIQWAHTSAAGHFIERC